ncbi:class I SAM-dependent methyltransferase [Endothiovibrio diazotrophicus]
MSLANDPTYLQYGCGWCAPEGWLNFDASPTLRFERLPLIWRLYTRNEQRFPANVRYGNVADGLPLANASCAALYCSHVLEHLALDELRAALAESHRLLRPDGRFRLVVPDLEVEVERYRNDPSAAAALSLMERTELGWESRPRSLAGLLREWLGNSRHRWMWDFRSLAAELEGAGFREIRRARFGDSAEPRYREVEDEGRWRDALGIECRR